MKIAVVGATGMVGAETVREALDRGHTVTGICRSIENLPVADGLMAHRADIFDRGALAMALAGHEAVIACYSSGHVFDPARNSYRETIEAGVRIVAAVKATENARLIFVGGAGSLVDENGTAMVDLPGYPEITLARSHPDFLQWIAALPVMAYDPSARPINGAYVGGPDYVPALARIKLFLEYDRSFDWSFFSPPPGMMPGSRSGRYLAGDKHIPIVNGRYAKISVTDAAVALIDEIEQRQHTWEHWTAYASD